MDNAWTNSNGGPSERQAQDKAEETMVTGDYIFKRKNVYNVEQPDIITRKQEMAVKKSQSLRKSYHSNVIKIIFIIILSVSKSYITHTTCDLDAVTSSEIYHVSACHFDYIQFTNGIMSSESLVQDRRQCRGKLG